MSYHMTIIQGNLGKDPELKTLSSGNDVANFSVAVTERWKSDGEMQEHTEWYNVKVFGKQAEVCEKYLHKGDAVLLAGRMRTRTYDKDGETKYVVELIVDRVSLLDNRGRDAGDRDDKPARGGRDEPRRDSISATTGRGEGRETRREEPRQSRRETERAPARSGRTESADNQDFDDDIPF
jgi:single-strand DNA-binding protein